MTPVLSKSDLKVDRSARLPCLRKARSRLNSIRISTAILALTITYWPWWVRVVYAETLSPKRSVFVEASQALGAVDLRIMVLHILPNILPPIIVRSTIGMGEGILTAAILGYLVVGAPPVRNRVWLWQSQGNIFPARGG
jgi:ABC-type dipeptide/oligopeptide/nickel transport system permease subunit